MQLTFLRTTFHHIPREKGNDRKKIYTAFRSLSKLFRGGTSGNPSSPLSLSSLAGGDDDKSSQDVATHNQIRPSPVTPPPASTLDWLFPAPPPTTPDILRGRDSAENTAHVLDVPHTVHPSHPLAPRVSRKPTPEYHPFALPPCCPPQPAREMVTRRCLGPSARGTTCELASEGNSGDDKDKPRRSGRCRRRMYYKWPGWRGEKLLSTPRTVGSPRREAPRKESMQRDRNYRSILNSRHTVYIQNSYRSASYIRIYSDK